MFVGKRTQAQNWVCAGTLVSAMGTPGRILPGEWKVMKIRCRASEGCSGCGVDSDGQSQDWRQGDE